MTNEADDTFLVEDDGPVTKPKRRSAVKQAEAVAAAPVVPPGEKLTTIIVEKNDSIPPCGLSIGLNGRQWLVKAARPVPVPPGVLEILDNAIYSAPVVDPDTLKVIDYEERLRYPYRIVKDTQKAA